MKLKRSIFNEYTGESKVVLNHHGEDYTGFALLHPNDWDKASKYAGCRLAEKRAHIKYLKKKRDEARLKRDALISFYKDLNNVASDTTTTIPTFVIKRICVHINYWNEAYKDAKYQIDFLNKSIRDDINIREKVLLQKSKKVGINLFEIMEDNRTKEKN